jgi:hypothetical protein
MDNDQLKGMVKAELEAARTNERTAKNQREGCYYIGMRDGLKRVLELLGES